MKHLKSMGYSLCLAIFCLTLSAGTIPAQARDGVNGRWTWKEVARRNKSQTQFSIVIRQKGKTVTGVYSVDDFNNGKWQGEDGNQTAFVGRVKGNSIRIEFDPAATVPGYEENVIYHPPTDGRRPSVAILTLNGSTLLWRFVSGDKLGEVPNKLSLHRDRAKK
jgi:hypothetical protein